jgi:hypothetical protein
MSSRRSRIRRADAFRGAIPTGELLATRPPTMRRRVRIVTYLRTATQDHACARPQECCVLHGETRIPQAEARFVRHAAIFSRARQGVSPQQQCRTRRSRTSCPARLRSARESDLRASSPAFTGHYGVELRIGASLEMPLDFHRSSPRFTTPASLSSLAVDVAIDVSGSYIGLRRSCKRPKARNGACPQETCVVHGVPQQFRAIHNRRGDSSFLAAAEVMSRRARPKQVLRM